MLTLTVEHAGTGERRQFKLKSGNATLGRGQDADWRIDDKGLKISRQHFSIARQGDGYVVCDQSSNGTFLNDARNRLQSRAKVPLLSGTVIIFGDFRGYVEILDDASANP